MSFEKFAIFLALLEPAECFGLGTPNGNLKGINWFFLLCLSQLDVLVWAHRMATWKESTDLSLLSVSVVGHSSRQRLMWLGRCRQFFDHGPGISGDRHGLPWIATAAQLNLQKNCNFSCFAWARGIPDFSCFAWLSQLDVLVWAHRMATWKESTDLSLLSVSVVDHSSRQRLMWLGWCRQFFYHGPGISGDRHRLPWIATAAQLKLWKICNFSRFAWASGITLDRNRSSAKASKNLQFFSLCLSQDSATRQCQAQRFDHGPEFSGDTHTLNRIGSAAQLKLRKICNFSCFAWASGILDSALI